MKKLVPFTLAAVVAIGATTAFANGIDSNPNVGENNDEMLLDFGTNEEDGIMMIDGSDMLLDFGVNEEEGVMMIDEEEAMLGMPVRELGYFSVEPVTVDENGNFSILALDMNEQMTQLNGNGSTLIVDAMTGESLSLEDLEGVTSAYAYMGMQQTMSLPPQRFAEAIIINMAMDAAAPMLLDITNIMNQGNAVTFGTSDVETSFTLDADMPLDVFGKEELTTVGEVAYNSRVLVWKDMTGEVSKVMEIQVVPFAINGNAIDTEVVYTNEVAYVSLRDVVTALDLTLAWNAAEKTATIANEMRTMNFTVGQDLYVSTATQEDIYGMTAPVELGAAPYIAENGTLLVPAMAFNAFVGLEVIVK
ncbi:stalk domain-containing protein [Chakrabartyella piscis]|uniref:stalk domain-containing protein n=1 Tax=Chakrabartyella piscis TaxID=2918914 RepID=UPI0029584BF4|nr:stalk domain-containing protein [Chakrabartyella piscis]